MNSKHRNIKFTVEREENNSLFSRDNGKFLVIFRDNGKFQTSVYRNPTFFVIMGNFRHQFIEILHLVVF